MKKAKRMQRKAFAPATTPFIVCDEAHLLLGSAVPHRSQTLVRRPNAGFIATQAVMTFNSGKRIRFLGSVTRADGSPLKPAPKKFVPAQVVRRLAA